MSERLNIRRFQMPEKDHSDFLEFDDLVNPKQWVIMDAYIEELRKNKDWGHLAGLAANMRILGKEPKMLEKDKENLLQGGIEEFKGLDYQRKLLFLAHARSARLIGVTNSDLRSSEFQELVNSMRMVGKTSPVLHEHLDYLADYKIASGREVTDTASEAEASKKFIQLNLHGTSFSPWPSILHHAASLRILGYPSPLELTEEKSQELHTLLSNTRNDIDIIRNRIAYLADLKIAQAREVWLEEEGDTTSIRTLPPIRSEKPDIPSVPEPVQMP